MLKATGAIGASLVSTGSGIAAAAAHESDALSSDGIRAEPDAQISIYLFFNKDESSFIEAAVARLIPEDDQWPGALKAGVPNYIDKQLAGAWGGRRAALSKWTVAARYAGPGLPAAFHSRGTVPKLDRCDQ